MAGPELGSDAANNIFENLGVDQAEFEGGAPDFGQQEVGGAGQDSDQGGLDNLSDPGDSRIPSSAEIRPDKQGNLRTPDGRLVARAGADARRYQDLHSARSRLSQTEARANDLDQKLRRAVDIGRGLHQQLLTLQGQQNAVKQFGLEPNEVNQAFQLYNELKNNPEDMLKRLLTRAAASGINVTNLGAGTGVDAKALLDMVKREIGTQMNPLRESAEAARRQAEAKRQQDAIYGAAQEEVNTFFSANQEAREYLPVFQAVLSQPQFSKMSLGEVWARIQLQLARDAGLTRPQGNGARRGIPSGRSAPAQGNSDLAPVSASYDSILNDVLDKAGMAR